MNIKIVDAKYHRNGIGGAGAFLVKFQYKEGRSWENLMAVFYGEEEDRVYTQVFDPENIENCFRSSDVFWLALKEKQELIEDKAFKIRTW